CTRIDTAPPLARHLPRAPGARRLRPLAPSCAARHRARIAIARAARAMKEQRSMAEAPGAERPGDRADAQSLDAWRERTNRQPLYRALGVAADDLGEGFTQLRVSRIPATAALDDDGAVDTFAISTAI